MEGAGWWEWPGRGAALREGCDGDPAPVTTPGQVAEIAKALGGPRRGRRPLSASDAHAVRGRLTWPVLPYVQSSHLSGPSGHLPQPRFSAEFRVHTASAEGRTVFSRSLSQRPQPAQAQCTQAVSREVPPRVRRPAQAQCSDGPPLPGEPSHRPRLAQARCSQTVCSLGCAAHFTSELPALLRTEAQRPLVWSLSPTAPPRRGGLGLGSDPGCRARGGRPTLGRGGVGPLTAWEATTPTSHKMAGAWGTPTSSCLPSNNSVNFPVRAARCAPSAFFWTSGSRMMTFLFWGEEVWG